MDIGDVLLRDAQFVWRERRALIARDAVLLLPRSSSSPSSSSSASSSPSLATARESFPLDGRFACEAVVVSAAHLHAVRLQDAASGREFLLDTRSRGKKQVWVELFRRARESRGGSLHSLQPAAPAASMEELHPKQLQERVRTSALQSAAGKLLRGADLQALFKLNDTALAIDTIGAQLVCAGVLEPCCCACGAHFSIGEFIYRVDGRALEQLVDAADPAPLLLTRRHRQQHFHRAQVCLLTEVTERVVQQFAFTVSLSGLEIVQLCVRHGVLNVPTAIAVGNELLQRGAIQPSDSSSSGASHISSFSMDRESKYIAGQPLAIADASSSQQQQQREQNEDFGSFYREHTQLKQRYSMLLYVFCTFCALVLLDGWAASVLPGPVKLALVAGVLAWLTLGDGSASFHINIRKSGHSSAVTAAFFSSPMSSEPSEQTAIGTSAQQQQLLRQRSDLPAPLTKASPQFGTESSAESFDEEKKALVAPAASVELTTSAEARARAARVHSFRLAIAQAASMPYEATEVYSDDYLYSVMTVKDRPFSYAVSKIAKCLEWRVQYGVDAITLDDVKGQLTSGSMYWYGYDFQHRPILWVRGRLKDWKGMSGKREAEIKAHIFLLEAASRELMPPGTTTYTVVTDSAKVGPSQMDLRLMHGLLDTCVAHYPDRVGMVHAGPMTRFLSWVVPMLWPFLPVRLRGKVSFMTDCVKDLSKHMKTELIPKHLGGTADHVLRPTPSDNPNEAMDVMYMLEQQKLRMKEIGR